MYIVQWSKRRGKEGKKKHRRKLVPVRRRCTYDVVAYEDARGAGWRGWRWRKKGRSRGERPPPRTRSLAPRLVSLGQSSAAESRAKQETDGDRKRDRETHAVKTGEKGRELEVASRTIAW